VTGRLYAPGTATQPGRYGRPMTSSDAALPPLTDQQKAARASSFGAAATHYERFRPGPPAAAVEWVLPRHVRRVVDLGAGTGGLTRQLVGRADEVVAVEPDDRMREVLAQGVPEARALAGRGESIPLEDASADAVFASSSWHWMELVPTLQEVGRVLVPGGMLGVMWSGPDRDAAFVQQAQALLAGDGPSPVGELESELAAAVNDPYGANQVLEIPPGAPFDQPEMHAVTWDVALTADDLVGLLGTFSWVLLMEEDARQRLYETARRVLRDMLGVEGDVTVDVGYRCEVWRARRHG
jgi:SAM-dependent methyltransferase